MEPLLKDPEMGLAYRPLTISFDEQTIPQQSQRPGQHTAFMLISNKEVELQAGTSKLVSHFTTSKLWFRKGATQVPIQVMKDNVAPLADNVRATQTRRPT